jgi:hypothetical protein
MLRFRVFLLIIACGLACSLTLLVFSGAQASPAAPLEFRMETNASVSSSWFVDDVAFFGDPSPVPDLGSFLDFDWEDTLIHFNNHSY